jgi:uncharacterized membrane protein HdeD (DUF308 family)
MTDGIGSTLRRSAPWRRGVSWTLVLIEGLIVIGIGLFLIFKPDAALSSIRGLTGGFLIFNSVLELWSGLRSETSSSPRTPYRLVRGGIGLVVGLIVVLQPVFEYVDANAARTILGVGLALWGAFGLLEAFATPNDAGVRWSTVIMSGLAIAFAVMIFATDLDDHPFVRPVGVIALIVGAILLGYSYVLQQKSTQAGGGDALPI